MKKKDVNEEIVSDTNLASNNDVESVSNENATLLTDNIEKNFENRTIVDDSSQNNEIIVTSAGDATFSASKRAIKRDLKNEKIRSRIWELDFLRGLCVILMIWDHLMFDVAFVFGDIWFGATGNEIYLTMAEGAAHYWDSTIRAVVRPMVVFCFFALCGISCSFSHSNFKRGTILLGFALLISAATISIGLDIYFGVLHMLAVSILIIAVIRLITKGKKLPTGLVCFGLGVTMILTELILGNVSVPTTDILAPLSREFASYNFIEKSQDYFPILPNTGWVLIGAAMAPLLYPKKRTLLPALDTQFRWYRPINFFGRHAAIFYITHQVVWALVLGIFTIIAIPDGWNLIVENFFS